MRESVACFSTAASMVGKHPSCSLLGREYEHVVCFFFFFSLKNLSSSLPRCKVIRGTSLCISIVWVERNLHRGVGNIKLEVGGVGEVLGRSTLGFKGSWWSRGCRGWGKRTKSEPYAAWVKGKAQTEQLNWCVYWTCFLWSSSSDSRWLQFQSCGLWGGNFSGEEIRWEPKMSVSDNSRSEWKGSPWRPFRVG